MAGSINPWNNQIAAANSVITLNAGTNNINIGTDNVSNSINIGTVTDSLRAITMGNTANDTTVTIRGGNSVGAVSVTSNGGTSFFHSGDNGTVVIGQGGGFIGTGTTQIISGSGGVNLFGGPIILNSSGTLTLGSLLYTDETINIGSDTTNLNSSYISIGNNLGNSSITMTSGSGGISATANNAAVTINSGTGSFNISNDAAVTTLNVGTGAAVKTTTLGSTNSTSATTVQSGSGALNITSNNGAITLNSGTGTVSIGSDATAATYNIATGAGAKVVTLGTTNTTSSLALKYGTADFTLASATGTVMSALDTGEITYPLQPAFRAYLPSTVSNATGDGTVFTLGSGTALTEVFDQGSDFVTTGTFTAPVTGKYLFYMAVLTDDTDAAHTTWQPQIRTASLQFNLCYQNGFVNNAAGGFLGGNGAVFINLTAADTVTFVIVVSGGTKVVDVIGGDGLTYVGGYLVC